MPLKKSYILPPTFDCPIDGPIRLGAILIDPKRPLEPVYDVKVTTAQTLDKFYTTEKTGWSVEYSQATSLEISLFAQALAFIMGLGADAALRLHRTELTGLKCDRLVTEWFVPTPEYLEHCLRHNTMLEIVKRHRRHGPALYILCGRKLAYGFSANQRAGNAHEMSAGLSLDGTSIGVPVQTGPGVSLSSGQTSTESFSGSSDIVLAYQLRRIFYTRKSGLSSKEYDRHASLSISHDADEEEEANDDGDESITSASEQRTDAVSIVVDGLGSDDIGSNYFGRVAILNSAFEDETEWELISTAA